MNLPISTNDLATGCLHLCLSSSSTALCDSEKSSPVHSLDESLHVIVKHSLVHESLNHSWISKYIIQLQGCTLPPARSPETGWKWFGRSWIWFLAVQLATSNFPIHQNETFLLERVTVGELHAPIEVPTRQKSEGFQKIKLFCSWFHCSVFFAFCWYTCAHIHVQQYQKKMCSKFQRI